MAKRRRHLTKKQQRYFGTRSQRAALRRKVGRKLRRRSSRGRVKATVTEKIVYRKNPRSHMKKRRHSKRRYRRHHVRHRRFRRNPTSGNMFGETMEVALVGAGGAIAVDYLSGVLPIPSSLTQQLGQYGQPLINVGLSLLVGVAVDVVAGPKMGGEAAAGGIIVALYNLANQMLPSLTGQQGNQQGNRQLNRYMRGRRRLGWINRQRRLRGLPPLASPATRGFRMLPRQLRGRMKLNPLAVRPGLGATSPFSYLPRGKNRGALRGGLGYIGPARTLGRYMQRG